MTTVENIIRTTNPTTIVKGENMVKGMYGKRQVVVNYDKSQDLFNIWAFTLKGVNLIKEYKVNGVFIEQLKETIEGMK
jgi:ABC-type tungstate transport system permease subunit